MPTLAFTTSFNRLMVDIQKIAATKKKNHVLAETLQRKMQEMNELKQRREDKLNQLKLRIEEKRAIILEK
jgi:hypothetical protein